MSISETNAGANDSLTRQYPTKYHQHSRSLSSEIVSVEGNESVEIHTDSDFDDSTNPRYSNYIYQEHGDDASFNIESDSDAESSRASKFSAYRNHRLESSCLRNSLLDSEDENQDDEEALTVAPLKVLPDTSLSHKYSNEEEDDDDDFFSLANSSKHSLDLESASIENKQNPLAFSSPVPSHENSPVIQIKRDVLFVPFENQHTSSDQSTYHPTVASSSANISRTGEPPVLLNSDTLTTTTTTNTIISSTITPSTSTTPNPISTTTTTIYIPPLQEQHTDRPYLHPFNCKTPEQMQDLLDSQAPEIPFPTTSEVPATLPKNLTPPLTIDPAKRQRKPSGVLTLAAKFEQEASTIISPTTPTNNTPGGQPSPPKGSKISSKVEELEKMLSSQPPTPTLRTSASLNGINGIVGSGSSSTLSLRASASASGFNAIIAAAEGNSGTQSPITFKSPNPILIPKAFEEANKSRESQKSVGSGNSSNGRRGSKGGSGSSGSSGSTSENEDLSASVVTECPNENDDEVDPLTNSSMSEPVTKTLDSNTSKPLNDPSPVLAPQQDNIEISEQEDTKNTKETIVAAEPADQPPSADFDTLQDKETYPETGESPTSNPWASSSDAVANENNSDTTESKLPMLDEKEAIEAVSNQEDATNRSPISSSGVNATAVSITPLADSTIAPSAGGDEGTLLNAHERDNSLTENVVGDNEEKLKNNLVVESEDDNKKNTHAEENADTDAARERAPSFSLEPIEKDDFDGTNPNDKNLIFAVYVVGFHHIRGPEVEYAVGGEGQDHNKLWPNLPFQSLPDGSHSHEENFCYFSLLYDNKNKTGPIAVPVRDKHGNITEEVPDMSNTTTLFGISCNRQLKATDLKERPDDVTRSTVQKSVIVIARKPIFGAIREKLAVITRAYFQQGDFEDRSLIDSLYGNLVQMFSNKVDESDLYVGMSLRELVHRLQNKVLFLLKALLLEKKIFFFGHNTEVLCASQFALVSLIPSLINNLEDCGSPLLKSYETRLKKPTSLRSSDRTSLLHYMGLPLQIFSEGGMFTAYVPLQQMDELKAPETKYFLVGSTNALLLAPQNCVADIVVHIDQSNVEVLSHGLNNALSLSSADKKWINSIVQAVEDTWDPEDPFRPKDLGFRGSEDYVRQQFEDYIMGLLSAVKYDRFLQRMAGSKQPNLRLREVNGNPIKQFNHHWIKEWRTTNNFRIFSKFTDDEVFDIVEPRHVGVAMQQQPQPSQQVVAASQDLQQGAEGVTDKDKESTDGDGPFIKGMKPWNSFWWSNKNEGAKKEGETVETAGEKEHHHNHHHHHEEADSNHGGLTLSRAPSNSSVVSTSQKSSRSVVSTSTGIFSSWSLWGNNSGNNHESKDDGSLHNSSSSLSAPGTSAPSAPATTAAQPTGFLHG